jgi:N6-adenosine-specific RNA methylase IME4
VLELVHPVTGEISAEPSLSLDLAPDLPFDEWCDYGRKLCAGAKVVNWWIGDWWISGSHRYGERAQAAAQGIFGREYQSLRDIGSVCRAFETSRRRDTLSFTHHREVAALPAPEADEILDRAEREELSKREVRAIVSQRRVQIGELPSADTCTVEDLHRLVGLGKRFGTIYADPPWLYDNQGTRAATGNHYGGMTVDELCELPVRDLAAPDAHLHLWTTNGFLFECPRIFDAWGFEFRSALVWVKPQMGIGNYWRNSHEYLLTAIRGNAKRFNDKSLKSWLECDRGEHSAKPEMVRHMIERASPGPFLEMFGRSPAKGWTVWGNQVNRHQLLPFHDVTEIAA